MVVARSNFNRPLMSVASVIGVSEELLERFSSAVETKSTRFLIVSIQNGSTFAIYSTGEHDDKINQWAPCRKARSRWIRGSSRLIRRRLAGVAADAGRDERTCVHSCPAGRSNYGLVADRIRSRDG